MESYIEEELIAFLSVYYCPENIKPVTFKMYICDLVHDLVQNGLEENLMDIYRDEMAVCESSKNVEYKGKRKWMNFI